MGGQVGLTEGRGAAFRVRVVAGQWVGWGAKGCCGLVMAGQGSEA